jgi:predicted nucleic acid-binding protein
MPKTGILYVDSSVVVCLALGDPKRSPQAWKRVREFDEVATSELAVVESQAGVTAQLSALKATDQAPFVEQNLNRILAGLDLISINSIVLGQARSLVKRYRVSVGLRSLDAIHVATANLLTQSFGDQPDVQLYYLTADRRQHEAFSSEGHIGELLGQGA